MGLVLVGWAGLVFNVVNVSLRQLLTPPAMHGRVVGIYRAATTGVMVPGALAGGAVAELGGLRLPWLLFGTGFLAVAAVMARRLGNRVVDRAVSAPAARS